MSTRRSSYRLGTLVLFLGMACNTEPIDPLTGIQAHAFATAEWSAPVDVGPLVNASNSEISPALSPDGLSLYFASAREGGAGGFDIWVSRRAFACAPFGAPQNLGPTINSAEREQGAFVSRDGHLLFFMRGDAGLTTGDILVSWRADTHDDFAWETPVPVGPGVNTDQLETEPWMVMAGAGSGDDDVGYLYFGRGPNNNSQDFYAAPITRTGETLGDAMAVAELNSLGAPPVGNEDGIAVRWDGREVVFASRRFETGAAELFVASRPNPDDPWGAPELLAGLNSARPELHPALSDDGRTLVFSSVRSGAGQFRLYVSTRHPSGRTVHPSCEG